MTTNNAERVISVERGNLDLIQYISIESIKYFQKKN